VSILVDHDTYYLDANIDGADYELGAYPNATQAGAAMVRWLSARGLTTALGSGRRLHAALNHCVVTFDIVRQGGAYLSDACTA
jgi:hypothetical protein